VPETGYSLDDGGWRAKRRGKKDQEKDVREDRIKLEKLGLIGQDRDRAKDHAGGAGGRQKIAPEKARVRLESQIPDAEEREQDGGHNSGSELLKAEVNTERV